MSDLLWTMQRSCATKKRYGSKATAVSAAKKVPRVGSRKAQAYHCLFCSLWHVGHGEAGSRVRRRKKYAAWHRMTA